MAYILRSMAVIGVIALNSPSHGGRSGDGAAVETARHVASTAARIDGGTAISGLTAAREAAQILAGLDPETRKRVLALTAAAATGRGETAGRDITAPSR